jgi:hypothetical protein
MDKELAKINERLINVLQSPKAGKWYKGCENIRVAPEITPEARKARQYALSDPKSEVADVALFDLWIGSCHSYDMAKFLDEFRVVRGSV